MAVQIQRVFAPLVQVIRKKTMEYSQKYEEVPTDAQEGLLRSSSGSEMERIPFSYQSRFRRALFPGTWVLGCLFLMIGAIVYANAKSYPPGPKPVFSPAQESMGYIRQVYPDAFHEFTHLMGTPGPELDKNWEQMYDLPSRIPKSQADLLEQPTIELPGDEGYYVILLDIFHSLHCLNEIRKSLHPEYYPPYHVRMNTTEKLAMGHLDHCVEHVRLALWCGADISPISFKWQEGRAMGASGYPHTCRNPVAILDWARRNRVRTPLP